RRCDELGVTVLTESRIGHVKRHADHFLLQRRGLSEAKPRPPGSAEGDADLACAALVLATGGRSLPRTGSDGGGYELARALGQTVTPTFPALVPLVLDPAFFH